ncbi:hypothetical protein FJY63_05955, partial [Candidatus Sumerlaeota bacterium]|nr:hypothetical protein [Candidatus Sumerlaeota bacterium]
DRGEEAYLIDFWDDDTTWGRDRIVRVFGGLGNRPEASRRQVDVLVPLTTPIAYISSLPRDPLIPATMRYREGGHSERAGKEGNESYMYMDDDPEDVRTPNAQRERGWNLWHGLTPDADGPYIPGLHVPPLKFGEWWFIGYGPTIVAPEASLQQGVREATAYDPTNGTVSVGCLFRRSGGESY